MKTTKSAIGTKRALFRSAAAAVAAGALVVAGTGSALAATSSDSLGSAESSDSLLSSDSLGSSDDDSGSAASSALDGIKNAWQQFVDAGVEVTVDTGSLGVWNTGSLGIEHNAPGMDTSFDDQGRLNVTITRPSGSSIPCTVALVTMDKALELATDPSIGNILGALAQSGPGVTLLTAPKILKPYEVRTSKAVEPGTYILASFCTTLAVPPISDIAVELMVVPSTGFGSVEQTAEAGSAVGSFALDQMEHDLLGSVTGSLGSEDGSLGSEDAGGSFGS